MLQQWNIRSRGHHCAVTERPFEEGERHYTAIYLDPETSEYTRRDVSTDAWKQELEERKPFSFWKSVYEKNAPESKPEITPREGALALLQRLVEDDNPNTENARYILAAMLERKRVLSPTDRKHTEQGIMQFYENKKTGDVFVIRDPELRLDEVAGVQEEVAMLLGFGGPAAEAAKAVGMKITPEGKIEPLVPDENAAAVQAPADGEAAASSTETSSADPESAPPEAGEEEVSEEAANPEDAEESDLPDEVDGDDEASEVEEMMEAGDLDEEEDLDDEEEDEGEDVMEMEEEPDDDSSGSSKD